MAGDEELTARVQALEVTVGKAVRDAEAARHMAAAVDRDFSEVNLKLDKLRTGLNELSLQTTERLTGLRREMGQRFDAMDQRFDTMDRRFDAMDQRFDTMDQRFDTMDQRFDGFEGSVNSRFDQVDAKFDQVDAKFELVDRNFDEMRAKFDQVGGGMQTITDMLTVLIERG